MVTVDGSAPGLTTQSMRGLIVLVALFSVTFADDGCVCEVQHSPRNRRASWGINYAGARIDAQEMRIAQLSNSIDNLVHRIDEDDDHHYNMAVTDLERRLERVEENDCGEHEFSCGRTSGQCISELLVCDHRNDCHNGHDEDEAHVCENQAPAGRSWSGRATWSGCINRNSNQMSLLITGNRRMNHFPSRLWVDAVIIDRWTEDHHEETRTWTTHGFYDYAHRRVVLEAPENSEMRIAMDCDDAGEGLADCRMFRESDGHVCGHAMLSRAV